MYQRKQKVSEEKWKIVADFLKTSKPTTNYSQNACRIRFEALENETATIPPELDDNPEERRAQRAAAKEKYAVDLANARAESEIADAEANAAASADAGHALDVPQTRQGHCRGTARSRKSGLASSAASNSTRSSKSSRIVNNHVVPHVDNTVVD